MNTDKNSIKENDENAFVFNKTLQVFDALKGPATQEEAMPKKDKVFAVIQSRIEPQKMLVRFRDLYIALTSVAATLLVVIGGISISRSESPNAINLEESIEEQRVEVYSPAGMISKLTLPDGSKVILNNNSTLSYPVKFSGNERKIELDGEAFFEIEKDSLKPFLINTEGMDVRVLGTSFNLKAYEADNETILSLKDGIVQAETIRKGEKEHIKLVPGEQLVVDRLAETLERKKVNVNWYTAWIDGKMVYRDETLSRILKDIEQRFDIDVVVQDSSLLKDKYFVSFSHGETVKQMLFLLSYKREWAYTMKNDEQVIITKRS